MKSDCNITGITNTLFSDNDLENNLELLGKLHNDCMTDYFNSVTQQSLQLNDQPNFDNHLRTTLQNFFENKGVILNEGNIYPCVNSAQPLWGNSDYQTNLSSDAQQIISNVVDLFNDESVDYYDLIQELNSLKSQAYSLNNDTEKTIVLSMIVVGINSTEYWYTHAEDWRNYFGNSGGLSTLSSKSSVLKKVGLSDAIGAVRGGIGGVALGGPAGIFAGALVGASVNSCVRAIVYGATGY